MTTEPELILRERELRKYDGAGQTARHRWIKDGNYPPAVPLGERARGWLLREISAWQRWRTAQRDGTAKKDSTWRDYLEPAGDAAALRVDVVNDDQNQKPSKQGRPLARRR
jgi:predicted DNA-binding transcriptional regulator AlpA